MLDGVSIGSFKKRLIAFIAGITFVMQIAISAVAWADSSGARTDLLGGNEIRSDDISPLSHWSALLGRFEAPLYSPAPASSGIAAWKAEINSLKGLPPHEQIERVNDFMNKVPYVDDQQRYGPAGYWEATPERFFSGGGDCKDYALVKYASLRALGFSLEQLRIAVVTDMTRNVLHAILIVKEPDAAYVLDNQAGSVEPVAAVHRYQPIFSVNSGSWWQYSG